MKDWKGVLNFFWRAVIMDITDESQNLRKVKKLLSLSAITTFTNLFAPNILGLFQQMEKQELFRLAYRNVH